MQTLKFLMFVHHLHIFDLLLLMAPLWLGYFLLLNSYSSLYGIYITFFNLMCFRVYFNYFRDVLLFEEEKSLKFIQVYLINL